MELKDIPLVAGFSGGGMYKYVVVELSQGGEKKTILRVGKLVGRDSSKWVKHREICYQLRKDLAGEIEMKILGGAGLVMRDGLGLLDDIASTELGPDPDTKKTIELLQEAFPGTTFEML